MGYTQYRSARSLLRSEISLGRGIQINIRVTCLWNYYLIASVTFLVIYLPTTFVSRALSNKTRKLDSCRRLDTTRLLGRVYAALNSDSDRPRSPPAICIGAIRIESRDHRVNI